MEVRRLESMGILTTEEAHTKGSMIRAHQEELARAGPVDSSQGSLLRNRILRNTSGPSSALDKPKGLKTTGNIPGSLSSTTDADAAGSASSGLRGGGAVLCSGLLVRDAKLLRFCLDSRGTLTQTALAEGAPDGASGKERKTWSLAGQRVIASPDSRKLNQMTVVFGNVTLKLGANSEAEMVSWINAFTQLG